MKSFVALFLLAVASLYGQANLDGSVAGVGNNNYIKAVRVSELQPIVPSPQLADQRRFIGGRYVRDGATSTDCTVGGGSNLVFCVSDGNSYTGHSADAGSSLPTTSEPIANPGTAGPYSYVQGATGSVGRTQTSKNQDIVSVFDFGSGTTRIATAATGLSGTPSLIFVPSFYSQTEALQGSYYNQYGSSPGSPFGDLTKVPYNFPVIDYRYGSYRTYFNKFPTPGGGPADLTNCAYILAPSGSYADATCSATINTIFAGGQNFNTTSYNNKTNYVNKLFGHSNHSSGQNNSVIVSTYCYGVGDCTPGGTRVVDYGGYYTGGDQGANPWASTISQGSTEFSGALTSSTGTGLTSVTVNSNSNVQGEHHFLINTTTGTSSAGTISSIASSGSDITTYTGSGTGWSVSTVFGALGTAVTTPNTAVTVTPTFTSGAIGNITTSTPVCVGDSGYFEIVKPSAVGASTFTAFFTKPHLSTAYIGVGGLCGYGIELIADDVTNSTFAQNLQTIVGTLRMVWPIVASTSATSVKVWVSGGGLWIPLPSRYTSAVNTYVAYPLAEIVGVTDVAGNLSNTLTLGPNATIWNTGDVAESPPYPSIHHAAYEFRQKYFPGAQGGFYGITFNGIWSGNDALSGYVNHSPASMFAGEGLGGALQAPYGYYGDGPVNYNFFFTKAGYRAIFHSGCATTACSTETLLWELANNASGVDVQKYNPVAKDWRFTYNNGASTLALGVDTIFPNRVTVGSITGSATATFAPQAGAGTGATAVCATSHVCNSFSGEVTLTAGSVGTPASGSQLIITLGTTRVSPPNCDVTVDGGTTFLGATSTETTTGITVSAGVALVFATPYTVKYVCGGN